MSYVGLAASASVYLEIPIVLRSLAVSLGHRREEDLPIEFDLGFISLLEIGTRPTDRFSLVRSYKQPWWKGCQTSKKMGIVTAETLESHLSYHHEELERILSKNDITPPININAKSIFTPESEGRAEELLEVVQTAQLLVDGLYVSATADRGLGMCRAAGFLMLHEASVSINTDGGEAGGREKNNTIGSEENPKWVTGNALTSQQAIQILEGRKSGEHEGYIHDLPEGKLDGEYSEFDSLSNMTLSESIFTVESASVNDVPPETSPIDWPSILNPQQCQPQPPSDHPGSTMALRVSADESDAMDIDVMVSFLFLCLFSFAIPTSLSAADNSQDSQH